MAAEREAVGTTHYDVLGVPRDATRQEIARAYRSAMRRLHPDASGDVSDEVAEHLAAVQEAWRVLQDAEVRAAYDRETAGPEDAWSDAGWGVDLTVAGDGAATDTGVAGKERRDGAPGEAAEDETWRTPFAAGAVRIPQPLPHAGAPSGRLLDRLLVVAAVLLTAATVTMTIRWRSEPVGGTAFGETSVPWMGLMVGVGLLAPALLLVVERDERDTPERAAAFGIGGIMAVAGIGLALGAGLRPALLGLAGAGALLALAAAVIRRRQRSRRVAAEHRSRMTAYHRAAEWNRLRDALRTPGSRVEESLGAPRSDEPSRVRTVDPWTREEFRRDLAAGLPRGGWVVVDDEGRVLCTAPPGALEAWLACWGRTRAEL